MSDTSAHRPVVHDAIGPDIPLSQAIACLSLGVTSLLMAGVLPALLGALADEHRLNAAGIGLTATFEALTMGIITGVSSVWLPPKRLKLIATIALLSLAVADFATTILSGVSVMAVRAFAGLPEGILLWITVGMIARTVTPERWAGVFFTAHGVGAVRDRNSLCVVGPAGFFRQWRLHRPRTCQCRRPFGCPVPAARLRTAGPIARRSNRRPAATRLVRAVRHAHLRRGNQRGRRVSAAPRP